MRSLATRTDKNSRIKLKKIQDYINILVECGTSAGETYMKHLDGDIWELRPLRDRIFFAARHGDTFVILHHFVKKTQKTPRTEIEKAKCELAEINESEDYEDE
ncbi:MAG: type II toxin-antitoxin system RelE/ParE family toxin [Synergistaceae bacterium]|nr:type II toxin-antitoxin system RelE/ParE family toxin [Synergistaceae bacterium]